MKMIFIVDDNNTNLLKADEVLSGHFNVITISSVVTMFEILDSVLPDIILLDIMMPDINGFDALKQLKADTRYENIPVVFLTGMKDDVSRTTGFELGAKDFIEKPFTESVLLSCINTVLSREP